MALPVFDKNNHAIAPQNAIMPTMLIAYQRSDIVTPEMDQEASIDEDQASRQPPTVAMPCFMERGADYIDGWKPPGTPSTDRELDFAIGAMYADMAISYARKISDPAVICFIVASIYDKVLRGQLVLGALENGFIDRLARLAYLGSLN